GESLVSDMPRSVGGGGSAPPPGWFLRAAVAGCDATVIAMRAAAEGIELSTLEVTVTSESDDRGFLGMDDSLPAGPLEGRTHVRIGADGVSPDTLREIVEWAEMHSPVSDALRRAVPTTVDIDIAWTCAIDSYSRDARGCPEPPGRHACDWQLGGGPEEHSQVAVIRRRDHGACVFGRPTWGPGWEPFSGDSPVVSPAEGYGPLRGWR